MVCYIIQLSVTGIALLTTFTILLIPIMYGPRVLSGEIYPNLFPRLFKRVFRRYILRGDSRRLVTAVATTIVLYILAVALFVMWPRTIYSAGFSKEQFAKIRPGMTGSEARKLIGEPLNVRVAANGTRLFQYSQPGNTVVPTFRWNTRVLVLSNELVAEVRSKREVFEQ